MNLPKHNSSYLHIDSASKIDVPGGKIIEEFIGRINTGDSSVSVAHMIAPPFWSEEPQTPEFDEITIMISGKMHIKMESESVTLNAGEVFFTKKGIKVQYSNPFDGKSEYWAICIPAFSVDLAGR
ncbi:MAG TPA: cupin [Bacteroidetes bacterium]|nr:cupin [Bacteroidota bacterium]